MKNTTHRVVILNNINSDSIAQAILILKDNVQNSDSLVMLEAERIVEQYMKTRSNIPSVPKKDFRLAGLLSAGVTIAAVLIFLAIKLI